MGTWGPGSRRSRSHFPWVSLGRGPGGPRETPWEAWGSRSEARQLAPLPRAPSSSSWAQSLGQVCVLGSPRRDAASVRPHGLRLGRADSNSPSPSLFPGCLPLWAPSPSVSFVQATDTCLRSNPLYTHRCASSGGSSLRSHPDWRRLDSRYCYLRGRSRKEPRSLKAVPGAAAALPQSTGAGSRITWRAY